MSYKNFDTFLTDKKLNIIADVHMYIYINSIKTINRRK